MRVRGSILIWDDRASFGKISVCVRQCMIKSAPQSPRKSSKNQKNNFSKKVGIVLIPTSRTFKWESFLKIFSIFIHLLANNTIKPGLHEGRKNFFGVRIIFVFFLGPTMVKKKYNVRRCVRKILDQMMKKKSRCEREREREGERKGQTQNQFSCHFLIRRLQIRFFPLFIVIIRFRK